jgi:hypothetical protein
MCEYVCMYVFSIAKEYYFFKFMFDFLIIFLHVHSYIIYLDINVFKDLRIYSFTHLFAYLFMSLLLYYFINLFVY